MSLNPFIFSLFFPSSDSSANYFKHNNNIPRCHQSHCHSIDRPPRQKPPKPAWCLPPWVATQHSVATLRQTPPGSGNGVYPLIPRASGKIYIEIKNRKPQDLLPSDLAEEKFLNCSEGSVFNNKTIIHPPHPF